MTATYNWTGIDSKGQSRGGQSSFNDDIAAWVEWRFQQGWRSLTVRDRTNLLNKDIVWPIVAKIEQNADGQRVWWAEL